MIPKLHYIAQGSTPKEYLENIQKACNSGAELVQLSLKIASKKERVALAQEAREITAHFQTRLIVCDDYSIAKMVKADGVHIESTGACPIAARTHVYTWQLVSGSANTLQDCTRLIEKQVDYIMLEPFRFVSTQEDVGSTLGLDGYTAIVDALKTETPIMGAGSITTEDVTAILETGISGIAVSEAITRDFNVIKTFHNLLKASSTEEQRHTFEKP